MAVVGRQLNTHMCVHGRPFVLVSFPSEKRKRKGRRECGVRSAAKACGSKKKMAKKTSPEKEKKGNRRNEVFMVGGGVRAVRTGGLSCSLRFGTCFTRHHRVPRKKRRKGKKRKNRENNA